MNNKSWLNEFLRDHTNKGKRSSIEIYYRYFENFLCLDDFDDVRMGDILVDTVNRIRVPSSRKPNI